MKKIVVYGLSAVLLFNTLGCQRVDSIGKAFKPSYGVSVNKDIESDIKFIHKTEYKGKRLYISNYVKYNDIVPILLYDTQNTQKSTQTLGFVNNRDGGIIEPIYEGGNYFKTDYFVNNLEPVKKDGKYGFINLSGDTVIEFKYKEAHSFSDGLAAVKSNNLYGYIDEKGNTIIKPQFKEASAFHNGVAIVFISKHKQALINKQGKIILESENIIDLYVPENDDKSSSYYTVQKNNNSALAKVENGVLSFITEYVYDNFQYSNHGFEYYKRDSYETGVIDFQGNVTVNDYNAKNRLYKVSNDRWVVFDEEGLCGLADANKKTILEPKFRHIQNFINENYTIAETIDGKQALINKNGELIIKPSYNFIAVVEEKPQYVIVRNHDSETVKERIYDLNQKQFIGGEYEFIQPKDENFIVGVTQTKAGLMNKDGKYIIEPYEDFNYEEHQKGYIIKRTNSNLYVTDLKGNKTSNDTYMIINTINEHGYRVVINHNFKYGLADKDGNLLVPCLFKILKVLDKSTVQVVQEKTDSVIIGTIEIPAN